MECINIPIGDFRYQISHCRLCIYPCRPKRWNSVKICIQNKDNKYQISQCRLSIYPRRPKRWNSVEICIQNKDNQTSTSVLEILRDYFMSHIRWLCRRNDRNILHQLPKPEISQPQTFDHDRRDRSTFEESGIEYNELHVALPPVNCDNRSENNVSGIEPSPVSPDRNEVIIRDQTNDTSERTQTYEDLERELRNAKTQIKELEMKLKKQKPTEDTYDEMYKQKISSLNDIYQTYWSNAFEELADMNIDDTVIIILLLQLFKEAHVYAIKLENEDTENYFLNKTRFKDIQRAIIAKHTTISPGSPFDIDMYRNTFHYGGKCLEWCLSVARETPVMFIEFEVESGSLFDEMCYRTYNKTGPVFDYMVWPALYENRHGRVLSKGVAQPR